MLATFLAVLIVSPLILPVHSLPYKPGVNPNQLAKYAILADDCISSIPAFFCAARDNAGLKFLNNTAYTILRVTDISGRSVALDLMPSYQNGSTSHHIVVVDLATGAANFTAFTTGSLPSDFFIVAGGLKAPDHMWKSRDAPMFNLTTTESVLGVSRAVNFLNYTQYTVFPGFWWFLSVGLAFDQESGVLVDLSIENHVTVADLGSVQRELVMHMVDTNMWVSYGLNIPGRICDKPSQFSTSVSPHRGYVLPTPRFWQCSHYQSRYGLSPPREEIICSAQVESGASSLPSSQWLSFSQA